MSIIWKIDHALEIFWGWLLWPLCQITGKSNFFFARLCCWASALLILQSWSGPLNAWSLIGHLLGSAGWCLMLVLPIVVIAYSVERRTSDDALPQLHIALGLYKASFLLIAGVAPVGVNSAPIYLLIAAAYSIGSPQGGHKSLARKALEKALSMLSKLTPRPVAA
jgi:hypothetical protein